MPFSFFRLFIGFCFVGMILSCSQKADKENVQLASPLNADSLIAIGKNYQNTQIDSLLPIAKKLATIAQTTGNKTALVYGELFTAHYYWQSADHQNSIAKALKCLGDAEKYNIKKAIPEIYLIIGNLHKENTNYKMAFEAQESGLKQAILNRDTVNIITLLSLRSMFIHTERMHTHDPSYKDTSINIQLTTLKMAESAIKYEKLRVPLYDNIAQYYLNNKDYTNAIYYGDKGAATAFKYNLQRSLTYSYSWLGMAWYFRGDKHKGLDYLTKAMNITRSLKEPYRQMEVFEHLYNCYNQSGDYKQALAAIMQSHKMRDSLQVLMNEKQISELQIKYESAKKDNEITSMDRKARTRNREIIVVLAGSFLFLFLLVVLFLQYRILKQSNRSIQKSNAQKDRALENIAYIQAHELRKPLASIMGLVILVKETDYVADEKWQTMLEEACNELDVKIHAIITHVENDNK